MVQFNVLYTTGHALYAIALNIGSNNWDTD